MKKALSATLLALLAACSTTPDRVSRPAASSSSADAAFEAFADPSANAGLATYALNYLGVPYRFGGASPASGFDCSGLVAYVSQAVLGLKLPRQSEQMIAAGAPVSQADLRPGDLVFYNTLHRKYSHVGIYLGDGRFVHSPSSGGVVRIESMDVAYWKKRFNGARRLASSEPSAR